MGYVYLGKTTYISHTYNEVSYGHQMQIKWKVAAPIPASVMQYAKLGNLDREHLKTVDWLPADRIVVEKLISLQSDRAGA